MGLSPVVPAGDAEALTGATRDGWPCSGTTKGMGSRWGGLPALCQCIPKGGCSRIRPKPAEASLRSAVATRFREHVVILAHGPPWVSRASNVILITLRTAAIALFGAGSLPCGTRG